MSVYDRLYSIRFAPASSDWREAIRGGIDVVHDGRLMRESIADRGFISAAERIPVWLSHDEKQPVGALVGPPITHKGWWLADFKLDASKTFSCVAADLLKVGTPISPGFRTLRQDKQLAENGTLRHTVAILDEISILRRGEHPVYEDAKVTRIYEPKPAPTPKPSPAARSTPAVAAGEEVIWGGGPYASTATIKRASDHDAAWMEEIQRRMDWIERRTGRLANMGDVMKGMTREICGPTLDELYAETIGVRGVAA